MERNQYLERQHQLDQNLAQDLAAAEGQLVTVRANAERLTARLLAEPAPVAAAPGPRPATVPLPDAFEGDTKKYLDFKTKLNNKFRADAPTF